MTCDFSDCFSKAIVFIKVNGMPRRLCKKHAIEVIE